MMNIAANYTRIHTHVAEVALRCGRRPEEITIVCAAKTKGPEAVRAVLAAGATDIGENYVQEARGKITLVPEHARWHLIGHLQRNKAKEAIRLFSLIHSLDSVALARELQRQAEKLDTTVRTLIEINLGGEAVTVLPAVRVEGFMTIPPPGPTAEASRPYFRTLARLRQQYSRQQTSNIVLRELSMGMTDDYAVAIEEGATIVRIGRAIFGERQ
jgi:uncharacterized pyridoxal phosphate-containing UPF0001 family protein